MIRCRDRDTRVEILLGARRIAAFQAELDAFRHRTDQGSDVTTSLQRLLLWSELSAELPVVLCLQRAGELYAVVLATMRRWRGIPTGLAKVGNLAGQGGIVAAPADRLVALEIAARTLLRTFIAHTVVISLLEIDTVTSRHRSQAIGMEGQWHCREARIRLSLVGGMPAVLSRLSYKMRRNFRYYRKRAEGDLSIKLVPEMTKAQREAAVLALHNSGPYPVHVVRARRLDAALQAMPGHFAMGLQDVAGEWISYIAGWRAADATYVDWQLNSDSHDKASICTVMRAYFLEHEIAHGSDAIVFVGLTNSFWARACEPQICSDLIATRNGVLGALVRQLAVRLRPRGQVASLLAGAGRATEPGLSSDTGSVI